MQPFEKAITNSHLKLQEDGEIVFVIYIYIFSPSPQCKANITRGCHISETLLLVNKFN